MSLVYTQERFYHQDYVDQFEEGVICVVACVRLNGLACSTGCGRDVIGQDLILARAAVVDCPGCIQFIERLPNVPEQRSKKADALEGAAKRFSLLELE